MDHNTRNVEHWVVVVFTEWAFVFIEEFGNKVFDLVVVEVRRVFSLFEEVSCRVLQFLHWIQIIYCFMIIWNISLAVVVGYYVVDDSRSEDVLCVQGYIPMEEDEG